MKKISIGWIIAALLVGLIAVFAVRYFRFVSEEVNTGATGKACSNRLYAAERTLQTLGAPIKWVPRLDTKQALPPKGVIVLQAGVAVSGRQWDQILTWVDAGGHLIVEVAGPDFGSRFAIAAQGCDSGNWSDGSTNLAMDEFGVLVDEETADAEKTHTVKMEDGQPAIEVRFGATPNLYVEDASPDWSAPDPEASQVLEFLSGDGRVTFVSSLQFADNWHIGEAQNAAFFWNLLSVSNKKPEAIWMVQFTNRPSFLLWLWQNGTAAILSGVLFVALWIWYLMPRFGPLEPNRGSDRRSLTEHLRASGKLAFRHRASTQQLLSARQQCSALLLRHSPGADLSHPEKIARLGAEITGMSSDALLEALMRNPQHAREITQIAHTLAEFRRRLAARRSPKQERPGLQ